MRAMILLCLVMTGCHEYKLRRSFDPRCFSQCSLAPEGKAGVGQCKLGRWECEDIDSVPQCVGSVTPSEEVCDNIDNDCDGKVDKYWVDCENSCGKGYSLCRDGVQKECKARGYDGREFVLEPHPETCNNKDDDCDGIVDNHLPSPPPSCYSGAPEDLERSSHCRYGTLRCINGQQLCDGEVTPSPEVCDGKDNDCDGSIDDGLGKQYDIVFMIDTSCSMAGTLDDVQRAVVFYATSYGGGDYKFALVAVDDASREGEVWIRQDFTDAARFITAVNMLDVYRGGGLEATLDGIWLMNQRTLLPLSWRSGAVRYAMLFTDEAPQTYNGLLPQLPSAAFTGIAPAQTVAAVGATVGLDLRLHLFLSPGVMADFMPVGGTQHNLYGDMKADLTAILSTACQ